jgi:CHAT domain-containing protein
VLSACETGIRRIKNGEGVYGLQRAFQTAGAKAVLMSLWKVDDTATGELMTLFYEQWMRESNKRKAFNMAQHSMRAKYPDLIIGGLLYW